VDRQIVQVLTETVGIEESGAAKRERSSLTYGFRTASALLEKLRRDRALLTEHVTPDRFFNFVVTGYHIIDWIKHDPTVPRSAKDDRESMYRDPYVQVCQDLANASKHFELDRRRGRRDPVVEKTSAVRGFGFGRYGAGAYGTGEESVTIVLTDGSRLDVLAFADNVVATWDAFFAKHGITQHSAS
jgi:hypothetical protein